VLKKIFKFILKVVAGFFLLSVLSVILFRFVPVPITGVIVERCIEQKMNGKSMKVDKQWVPLDKISNHLQLAAVVSEDQQFLWHHGFDFDAIDKAMEHNKKQEGRKHPHIHGASTISQQTAKNVFLWEGRNFLRKGVEVYFTFLIELFWSKQRIMEVYLNVAEWGDGIYGAEAASEYYFNEHASALTPAQAAYLVAILPGPLKWSASRPTPYIVKRHDWILGQMENWGGTLDYKMKEE
jgi:monofunctional biosynthetic peptidoglycan transglycosylase